jgi:hypothetical protein
MAFGIRVMPHEEVQRVENMIRKEYKLSPTKIRQAGIEDLMQL